MDSESLKEITFYCEPYQEEPDMPLKRRTIYYYDTKKRGVVEIGKFAAEDDREAVEEIARAAIIDHVRASSGLK